MGNIETSIGDKIAKLRRDAGLTMVELGRMAGFSNTYIWSIEKGRIARPSAKNLHRIANALGVETRYLIDENDFTAPQDAIDAEFCSRYVRLSREEKKAIKSLVDLFTRSNRV